MSNLKISSNLFLGTPELTRLQEFLGKDGNIRGLLNNSVSFGLIKNDYDISFNNAKVSADADINIGGVTFKTIKINPISGFDKYGNFLVSEQINQLPIPGDIVNSTNNRWYWLRISHKFSHEEKGLWNLSNTGILTGSGGELTKIARGNPNFPTRIRFTKDTLKYGPLINTQDFDILEITDDNNCILNGVSFQNEQNLKLNIVGTFTYGAPIDPVNKMIFNYDSVLVELIEEPISTPNQRPTSGFESDRTFYIARVRVDGNNIIIQDKRTDYWETKSSFMLQDIDGLNNPLIGIEAIKFDHPFTTRNFNIVEVAWTFRTTSWNINTEDNVVTLSSGQGGLFKSVNDFSDGDFDGWRLYTQNGKYFRIVNSVKQGNAIDLQLDTLDIDAFSPDGGNTFYNNYYVIVAPNAEAIELTFTPRPSDNVSTQTFKYEFEINKLIGSCKVLAYGDPISFYQLSYRYRNNLSYSPSIVVTEGKYYDESSFDENGNLLPPPQTNIFSYSGSSDDYLVQVIISPQAYKNFNFRVDKGDLIGTQIITSLSGVSNINLLVGQNFYHQYFTGNLTLNSDITIEFDTSPNAVNGNRFILQFNCNDINLNGFVININSGVSVLKTLRQGDVYQMKNIDGGIVIEAYYNGTNWILSQNYDLGVPGEMKSVVGVNGQSALTYFDSNGWGNVKGLFGYRIADGSPGSNTIDMRGMFQVGYSPIDPDYSTIGNTGGEKFHTLLQNEQGSFDVRGVSDRTDGAARNNAIPELQFKASTDSVWVDMSPNSVSGGNVPIPEKTINIGDAPNGHENRPPFVTVLFAQKMF